MLDHDTSKDAPLTQVIPFDGNSITLERIQPFGFVGMTLAKGTLPERYTGVYTSFDLAAHAAQEYIEQNRTELSVSTKSDSNRKQLR